MHNNKDQSDTGYSLSIILDTCYISIYLIPSMTPSVDTLLEP